MASVTAVHDERRDAVHDERRDAVPRVMQYMSCVVEDYTAADFKKKFRLFYYI